MNYLQRLHTTEALANWTSLTALTHTIELTHTSISENICVCVYMHEHVQLKHTFKRKAMGNNLYQYAAHIDVNTWNVSKDTEGTNEAHRGTRWWNHWESQSSVRAGLTYQSFLYSKRTEEREGTHTDCTNWYRDTSEQQSFGRGTDRLCQQSAEMMSQSEADRAKRSQSVRRRLRIRSESCTNILFLQYTVFAFVYSDDLLKLPLFAVYSRAYCTV